MIDSVLALQLATIPDGFREQEAEGARDENDAIIRREKATRAQFEEVITVFIDGYRVDLPKAVPETDAQGNPLRDADDELVPRNSTIYDAALRLVERGIWELAELHRRIPVLCHQPHLHPVGVCRMCSVWIVHTKRGEPRTERKLLPACHHLVTDAMRVTTRAGRAGLNSQAEAVMIQWTIERAKKQAQADGRAWAPTDGTTAAEAFRKEWAKFLPQVDEWAKRIGDCQKVLAELLVADHLKPELKAAKRFENELQAVADVVGVDEVRNSFRRPTDQDRNHPADRRSRRLTLPLADHGAEKAGLPYSSKTVVVDHDRCILCDRCVRSCHDVKPFQVIGHTGKGYGTRVSFDLDDLMGNSSCVQCGECMTACPTGALSVRRRVQPRVWDDSPQVIPLDPSMPFVDADPTAAGFLTADEMREVVLRFLPPGEPAIQEVRPFAAVSFAYLKWNEGAVRRWVIPPGKRKTLCKEGEYGSTAFLLDGSGACEIWRGKVGKGQLLRTAPGTELIQGEMACLTHAPRSASVVAAADADKPMTVYEITRNLLDMMQRTPGLRQAVGGLYAQRAVEACVRSGGLFAPYQEQKGDRDDAKKRKAERRRAVVDFLIAGSDLTLRRLDAGQVIVREGDPAGGDETFFYIVRLGTLKVTKRAGGRDKVLNTLTAGGHFGEAALRGESLVRTASVSTLDPSETVLVPKAKFLGMLRQFPEVAAELDRTATARRAAEPVPSDVLSEYVEQGLYQAQRLLALDLTKCTRCDECTKACADSHPDGNARLLREGLRFGKFLVATSCRSCHTPYCMEGCPVDAIHRRGTHLEVMIEDHCIGCGLCEKNCPYGSIHMVNRDTPYKAAAGFKEGNPNLKADRKSVNCDLCGGGEPYCVDACPHDAAIRVDGPKLLQLVQGKRG